MRLAGPLLSILALLAVQAPWVACTCFGGTSLTPVFFADVVTCECTEGEHGHDHHHGHGHHHHGHHHHDCPHEHGEEHDEHDHEGFRLALPGVPPIVSLDGADDAPFSATPGAGAVAFVNEVAPQRPAGDPPERPTVPAAATERLLL